MNLKTALLALSVLAAPAAHAQQPDAAAIIRGARMGAVLNHLPDGLSGHLSKGGRRVPVTLFLKGPNIQFQFQEAGGPWQVFHMRLGDNSAELMEIVGGKTVKFPPGKLVAPIAGTDLTYEDLSMRFLYWPQAAYEGMENVGPHACHKIRLTKPRGQAGRYATVHVWVHAKYGAFMRVRGYDPQGGVLKEFEVRDVMQVAGGAWTLRKMQVGTFDPRTNRRVGITDVNFDAPRRAARPGGLR